MATDKSKIKLPSSSGGIMQYYDEYTGKMHIKPMYVVIMVLILMLLVIIFNALNPFGF